ncbi:EVE domain-containing protein [Ferrovibrio terrae]|uniref:EVE domain-containing protein n=1 Tax=Ferrovibrio terrae TaxID=2594003 RepID=UPI00313842C0
MLTTTTHDTPEIPMTQTPPITDHPQHWIAIASADHVRRGRAGGFMQVCHGREAPLLRIAPGDSVAYYSPSAAFQGSDRLQAFTAFGVVAAGKPYQVDMGGGFQPWRRDVDWYASVDAPIQPLLQQLDFTAGQRNWGYRFRLGLCAVSAADMRRIARAMGAQRLLNMAA